MRIAESLPIGCAACGGQYHRRHIDFEVAYDGPMINSEDNIKMAIDDLIVCEDCLALAAKLIGYVHDDEAREMIEFQAKQIDVRDSEIDKLRKVLKQRHLSEQDVEAALA